MFTSNPEMIHRSVAPGQSSTLWKGVKSNRYYNTKKKALRDNSDDYYKVRYNFNTQRAALAALVVLIVFFLIIKK